VTHIPNDVACGDGLFCNGAETCDPAKGCLPGSPPDPDDGIACTLDGCDEATDTTFNTPHDPACADGVFCNGVETCDTQQGCLAGAMPNLSDDVDCTDDTCDEENEAIVHTPNNATCDDALFCNGAEACDSQDGCQPGIAPQVSDNVDCTVDACDESNDIITHAPSDISCSDGLFCNGEETCDVAVGCQPSAPPTLTDNIDCTVDQCNEANDTIIHTPNHVACDDALFCNGTEQCDDALGCQPGQPPALEDGVVCTVDSCDEANDQILHVPNDAACDDALFCNGAEQCEVNDGCTAGVPPSAADNLDCTLDSCDEANDQILHIPDEDA
jgi:hypothetical protein